MDVERHADDVFLQDVILPGEQAGALLEIHCVAQEHVALAAGRAVEFHDHGPVDLAAGPELARHFEPGTGEPLALQLAARFPIEHGLVAEIRDRHLLVFVEREVRDERTVRHDDDLAFLEFGDEAHELRIRFDRDHFIDEAVAAIEPFHVAVRDRERMETLVVRALEDLQRGMRAQRCDGIELAGPGFAFFAERIGVDNHRHRKTF